MDKVMRLLGVCCLVMGSALGGCGDASSEMPTDAAEPENRAAPSVDRAARNEPSSDEESDPAQAPTGSVAAHGFPEGSGSPEGVACDLARAFMRADAELFQRVCLPLARAPGSRDAYNDYLDEISAFMVAARGRPLEELGGPKQIERVYAARALTRSGPASYAYAAMQLDDVRFVDVVTTMWDGTLYSNRTLVLRRASDEQWFAMPRPDLFPLLSAGLNEEPESEELWEP